MDRDEARARMQEIQRIMERATLWTHLPGTAAFVGGLLVLAGCGVSYALLRTFDFADMLGLSVEAQAGLCVMWFAIGAAGLVLEVALTARAAKIQGLFPSIRSARVAAFALTPSVLVAMVLTVKFLMPWDQSWTLMEPSRAEIQYIVPLWMMLYGTGVYTAGLFSVRAPRILGGAFIATGVVALPAFPQYGVLWAALSFGLFHVVFGTYILAKQRQDRAL
jgi:hypothetical protein